jgi:two-component system, NarL family, sensor kinase
LVRVFLLLEIRRILALSTMGTPPPYIVIFLVVTMVAVAAVLTLLLILILLNQKRQRTFKESMERLKLDHEKHLLTTQVEIQEQTFLNISQEIHDNISLSLTLAKLNLYMIGKQSNEDPLIVIQRSMDLISEAILDLSSISKSLNPELISQQGIMKALQQEVDRIRRCTELDIDLQITGEPVYLCADRELFIFRIVQETFNNVLKHAEARSVKLEMHYNNSHVELTFQDDGKGFDEKNLLLKKGQSAGLANMENRVSRFNGDYKLVTSPGEGTKLFVTIPFES